MLPSFLLGFHGTDAATAERVLSGTEHLKPSQNEYDWLGHGIYFWEYSPRRAYEFIKEKFRREKRHEKVAVIGAIIDPGICLNLLEASSLDYLTLGYAALVADRGGAEQLPKNGEGKEDWKRLLDCAVINMVHALRESSQTEEAMRENPDELLPSYQTVRGAFWEGGPVYPGGRIQKKNHIQICVRDTSAIKGYFKPIEE